MDINATQQDENFIKALIELLRQATSPAAQEARNLMLRRIAEEGDVIPSRLPAPRTITEIGGYINLLETLGQPALRDRTLASALGVAPPITQESAPSDGPILFFGQRPNDRPECLQQPSLPISFTMRNDFLEAFDIALQAVHVAGCSLPLLAPVRRLPDFRDPAPSAAEMLELLGRTLELAPTAALLDPTQDPLLVLKFCRFL